LCKLPKNLGKQAWSQSTDQFVIEKKKKRKEKKKKKVTHPK
jgi:hypothetical protein